MKDGVPEHEERFDALSGAGANRSQQGQATLVLYRASGRYLLIDLCLRLLVFVRTPTSPSQYALLSSQPRRDRFLPLDPSREARKMPSRWIRAAGIMMEPIMGFGHLTKQFATEAIADALSPDKPEKPAVPETLGAGIVKQVQAMQGALKDGEELMVLFHNGIEALRVLDFFQPSPQMVVMTGLDDARNVTRVILPGDRLQLTCKVMKVQAGAAPVRVRFITAK
jgi:hypothetical protein